MITVEIEEQAGKLDHSGTKRTISRAGHVKSCLNMGGPSSKAKYSSSTDSEPVP